MLLNLHLTILEVDEGTIIPTNEIKKEKKKDKKKENEVTQVYITGVDVAKNEILLAMSKKCGKEKEVDKYVNNKIIKYDKPTSNG